MILDISNLDLSVADRVLLKSADLTVQNSEFVCLLGPNGSGKTSFLKAIIGLLKPQSGSIKLGDDFVANISQAQIGNYLSYVPQQLNLAIDCYCEQFFTTKKSEHAKRVIEELDVHQFMQRRYLSLSGGEKQKLLLASALARDPKFLIIDELTQYADKNNAELLGNYLVSYKSHKAIGILAVSHHLDWASKYATRFYQLRDRRILECSLNQLFFEQVESLDSSLYAQRA